ncbi:hypothetical protein PG994_002067 [Apiospora phragmitis]|uniref:Uncharacterized protein n=1 Tax=Apiospora phragmitis TaxID=2905665 RepID=A0ABR1WVA8_9PEZI
MPKRRPNLDFDIHVDPSCLSDSMEDETKSPQPVEAEAGQTAPEAAPTDTTADDASIISDKADEATSADTAVPPEETNELMEEKPGHDTEGDEASTIFAEH